MKRIKIWRPAGFPGQCWRPRLCFSRPPSPPTHSLVSRLLFCLFRLGRCSLARLCARLCYQETTGASIVSIFWLSHVVTSDQNIRPVTGYQRPGIKAFVKYEAGLVWWGGGRRPPPSSTLTRAWELVFMTAFFFFFQLHCSGPIEFTLPYRGTGG